MCFERNGRISRCHDSHADHCKYHVLLLLFLTSSRCLVARSNASVASSDSFLTSQHPHHSGGFSLSAWWIWRLQTDLMYILQTASGEVLAFNIHQDTLTCTTEDRKKSILRHSLTSPKSSTLLTSLFGLSYSVSSSPLVKTVHLILI